MSKNIVMQELTANGYEELYPKTNTQEIVSSNTTINQFLGGGDSLEDALGYLAGLNQHWWLKKSEENVYGLIETKVSAKTITLISGTFSLSQYSKSSIGPVSLEFSDSLSVNRTSVVMNNSTKENFYFQCYREEDTENDRTYYRCDPYYATKYPLTSSGRNDALEGKYVRIQNGDIFKTTDLSGAVYSASGNGGSYGTIIFTLKSGSTTSGSYYTYTYSSAVVGTKPTYTYVSSPNPSAYPDNGATQDNAQYWYIGQPFTYLPRLGKVEVGSYVGTGSGSATLTFENTPKILKITKPNTNYPRIQELIWIDGQSKAVYTNADTSQYTTMTISNKNYSFGQLNMSNETYNYFAITQ